MQQNVKSKQKRPSFRWWCLAQILHNYVLIFKNGQSAICEDCRHYNQRHLWRLQTLQAAPSAAIWLHRLALKPRLSPITNSLYAYPWWLSYVTILYADWPPVTSFTSFTAPSPLTWPALYGYSQFCCRNNRPIPGQLPSFLADIIFGGSFNNNIFRLSPITVQPVLKRTILGSRISGLM